MKNNKAKIIETNNTLIKYYSQFPADSIPPNYSSIMDERCPLCVVSRKLINKCHKRHFSACDVCPYVIFEGADCDDLDYGSQTAGQCIARLQGWNKKLGVKS